MALVGAGQRLFADGCDLSRVVNTISHESEQTVAESTAIEHDRRRRVHIGISDDMVTLSGYYDPTRNGLAQLPAFRGGETGRVTRMQHVLGDAPGAPSFTYEGLVMDNSRSLTTEVGALMTQDVKFSTEGGGVNGEWVYGGQASFTDLNTGRTSSTTYLLGNPVQNPTIGDAVLFDRQSLGGTPDRIQMFFHVSAWERTGSGTGAVQFSAQASNGSPFTAWQVNGFTQPTAPAAFAAPATLVSQSTGVNRRWLAPALTVPGNVVLTGTFSVFYRILP